MAIDPAAPIELDPHARTAEALAALKRDVAALQRRQFDPFNWALQGAFVPNWRTVGDPGEPALSADWDVWSTGLEPKFWKDPFGVVHLAGTVTPNTLGSITIFTLPADHHPFFEGGNWVGNNDDPLPILGVASTGIVVATAPTAVGAKVPVGNAVHLEGASFYAGNS